MDFSLVVAGGYVSGTGIDSVEILDSITGSWRAGPNLPQQKNMGAMVEDPDGGVLYLGGTYSKNIYRLIHAQSQWIVMEQYLKALRSWPVAFLIPDEITNCTLG